MRGAVERISRPALLLLVRLPSWVPFLAMLAFMVTGVLVGGPVGGALIVLVALVLAWLLYLSWPGIRSSERMVRLAVIVLAVGIAIVTIVPNDLI